VVIASGVLAASSSIAGISGAIAGGITAITALLTVIAVLIPQLKGMRNAQAEQAKAQNEQTKTLDKQTEQLGIIHALSNSTLSIAMGSELEATRRELAVMGEVVDLRKRAGLEISVETIAAMDRARNRVAELTLLLQERQKQAQDIIDAGGDFTPPDTSTRTAPSGA
jgi:hypothetical protein